MIPQLGLVALILALFLALTLAYCGLWGPYRGDARLMGAVRPLSWGLLAFTVLSYGALTWAFVTNDFMVRYVAENSSTRLPLFYRIAGVWGAHEGSMLLWILILVVWTAAVAFFSRGLPQSFVSRVLGVLGLVSAGFLAFSLLTSNPFVLAFPVPHQGGNLDPLLQDPFLAIHPPMLYMGYVGMSVAFAFAVAALLGGTMDQLWARWTRPWTIAAWMFLTAGIVLGSYWSYYVLGWGGWWFWDPVENASFMPWLVGAALIHSLAVTEKRGAFKSWTALLAITAFSLSLLGTFLVRSGVLISVHAFAMDPRRGMFVLALLAFMAGAALTIYLWRAPYLMQDKGSGFRFFSRETFLLFNNIFLVVGAATVFIGALYPLFVEALGLQKLSVGPPYFDHMFIPVILPLFVLMGIGPFVPWMSGRLSDLLRRLRWPLLLAVVAWIVVLVLAFRNAWPPITAVGVMLSLWVMITALREPAAALLRKLRGRTPGWNASTIGMSIAHFGLGLAILGITVSTTLSVWRDDPMHPGKAFRMAGFTFVLRGYEPARGRDWQGTAARFLIYHHGRLWARTVSVKKDFGPGLGSTTGAGIVGGGLHDLFVALGNNLGDARWSVRFRYEPMVIFVWLGGLVMALGGFVALWDRRYRWRRLPPPSGGGGA
jgi:cytochrome c-type biogenesis protein CcmF